MLFSTKLSNGLTILGEPMPWLKSCAFVLSIPAGVGHEQTAASGDRLSGQASFVCEMALRGCGRWDSHQFMEVLQEMGVNRGENVGISGTTYSATMPGQYLFNVLEIYAALAQEAHLAEESLDASRLSVIQERAAIEDDPSLLTGLNSRLDFFPKPWGFSSWGETEVLQQLTLEQIQQYYHQYYQPQGAILSVAGNFEWDTLIEKANAFFGEWKPTDSHDFQTEPAQHKNRHIEFDSQQTHISVAYDSLNYSDPNYYRQWAGTVTLGRSDSGRLFTEIREKRGLCYSVSASSISFPSFSGVFCRASTSTPRAKETLEQIFEQVKLMKFGISQDELNRVKIMARTSMIMEQESCASRAKNMISDWRNLHCLPDLDTRLNDTESLTLEQVNDFLANNSPTDFQVTTLGPEPITEGDFSQP